MKRNQEKPILFVIAGPNGSGKSTNNSIILQSFGVTSFDWDAEFLKKWKRFGCDPLVERGVIEDTNNFFEESFKGALTTGEHFAFETNLHDEIHLELVNEAKSNNFLLCLIFFYMPDVRTCIERVKIRIKSGGHGLPDKEIIRRYKIGLQNLKKHYKDFESSLVI